MKANPVLILFVILFFFLLNTLEAAVDNLEIRGNLGYGKGPVYSLSLSEDGKFLAASDYGGIYIWNTENFESFFRVECHGNFIWGLDWGKNGDYLASAGQDGNVTIWKAPGFQESECLNTGWAFCIGWSPEGNMLAVGNWSGEIQLWDTSSWTKIEALKNGVSSQIICLCWLKDGKRIAAGRLNGDIEIWDADKKAVIASLGGYTYQRCDVNGISCSPDGKTLATAHQDGRIRFWNLHEYALIKSVKAHDGWVRGIKWSPDGNFIASSGEDGKIKLWNAKDYSFCLESRKLSQPIWSLYWSKNGKTLFSGSGVYDRPHIGFSAVWDVF